jgi:phage/plasmid replication protein, gene II/X family
MIDWLTMKLPLLGLPDELASSIWHAVADRAGRMLKIDAAGKVEWEKLVWEKVRSDIGSVICRVGDDLEIMGSPARALGSENVFGTGDICVAARSMIGLVAATLALELPDDLTRYRVTRCDVTANYDLGDAASCRVAIDALRYGEGGRFRGRSIGGTIYWNQKSSHASGKAYHKGQHLRFLAKKEDIELEPWQFVAADRLLRLELSLRRHWWDRAAKHWTAYTEQELEKAHADYFQRFIGSIEVKDMDTDILDRLLRVCPSKGRAAASFRTLVLIRTVGLEQAKTMMAASTFRHHTGWLIEAGLSLSDLRAGNVLPLRRKTIVLGNPVRSWDELRAA